MRSTWKAWRSLYQLAVVVTALALAGCNGASIVPGHGGSGGLGTPGTGTGDPDATMVFNMRGGTTGNFEAGELRTQSSFLGYTIQGIEDGGSGSNRVNRVGTLRFPGLPVAGRTYLLKPHEEGDGSPEEEHAIFQYSELYSSQTQIRIWAANAGTIHVDRVTADHVAGTFQGTLVPSNAAATGTLTATDGEFSVKYQQPQG